MSKVGLTAITRIHQRMFDKERSQDDIVINALCPGFVDTDMSSHKGHLTPEQGKYLLSIETLRINL
jgi:carbonyl reductase 1